MQLIPSSPPSEVSHVEISLIRVSSSSSLTGRSRNSKYVVINFPDRLLQYRISLRKASLNKLRLSHYLRNVDAVVVERLKVRDKVLLTALARITAVETQRGGSKTMRRIHTNVRNADELLMVSHTEVPIEGSKPEQYKFEIGIPLSFASL